MGKNPISELILNELAAGASFKELQARYHFSKSDLINAAVYGVEELHNEYLDMLIRKLKSQGRIT